MAAPHAIAATLEACVAEGLTAGVVAAVATREGPLHESAHGAAERDSVFRLYSMTKAIASVAALRLIEAGQMSLDTPVAEILPEFARLPILSGFDAGGPILAPAPGPVTLRHLLTHSSGLVYPTWNKAQARFMAEGKRASTATGNRAALHSYPLHFAPGTAWAYGPSTDWLGLVVEAVTGMPIAQHLRETLFGPLGMASTDVALSASMAGRLVPVHREGAEGLTQIVMDLPKAPEFFPMGHALYGTAPDYLRFLTSLLAEEWLSPTLREGLFSNAIGPLRVRPMASVIPSLSADFNPQPGIEKTHSLAFLRTEADVPGGRRAGSLSWAGIANTHFWLDPKSGIAAVLMMQQIPFCGPGALAVLDRFERAVYAQ